MRAPSKPGDTGPAISIDADSRWEIAGRLLHDGALDVGDRVAGALLLLYAQPLSRIARLTKADVGGEDGELTLSFGRDGVVIPEPLAGLIRQLPWRRRHGASAHLSQQSAWLFPGARAGRPMTPGHLGRRMSALGIDVRASRNAALLQLAGEVPVRVLADLLNVSIRTATNWVRAAGGDWSGYAAQRAGGSS